MVFKYNEQILYISYVYLHIYFKKMRSHLQYDELENFLPGIKKERVHNNKLQSHFLELYTSLMWNPNERIIKLHVIILNLKALSLNNAKHPSSRRIRLKSTAML